VLDSRALADLTEPYAALVSEARDAVLAQGVPEADISIERRVALKYEGTDSTLQLPVVSDAAALSATFLEQYRVRYGFLMPERRLVIESISAEAVGASEHGFEGRRSGFSPTATRSRAEARPTGVGRLAARRPACARRRAA